MKPKNSTVPCSLRHLISGFVMIPVSTPWQSAMNSLKSAQKPPAWRKVQEFSDPESGIWGPFNEITTGINAPLAPFIPNEPVT